MKSIQEKVGGVLEIYIHSQSKTATVPFSTVINIPETLNQQIFKYFPPFAENASTSSFSSQLDTLNILSQHDVSHLMLVYRDFTFDYGSYVQIYFWQSTEL